MSRSNHANLSPGLKAKISRLRSQMPTHERKDLKCPDCGAKMVLKVGRYGRFYGCTKWKKTGCQGSHSAHDDGRPMGTLGKRIVRRARKKVMDLIRDLHAHDIELPPEIEWPNHVGQWGLRRCNDFLVACGVDPVLPPTAWERLDSLCIDTG